MKHCMQRLAGGWMLSKQKPFPQIACAAILWWPVSEEWCGQFCSNLVHIQRSRSHIFSPLTTCYMDMHYLCHPSKKKEQIKNCHPYCRLMSAGKHRTIGL